MNVITIAGNVGKSPEMRQLQSGDSVLQFSVADNWQEKGEKKTAWYSCSIWGERAIKLQPHIRQGEKITVCGQLRPREYTDKQGQTRMSFDVRVQDVALQGAKETADKPAEKPRDNAEQWKAGAAPADFSDEDIPF